MRLTVKQLAEFYDVDRRTITNWVNSTPGCPSWKEGSERFFDSVKVAAWREAKARAESERDATPLDLEEARARKMTADAELAELELGRLRGELVPVDAVRTTMADLTSRVRAQLLAIPGRYSARIVGLPSLAEAARALDLAMRDVLNELKEG